MVRIIFLDIDGVIDSFRKRNHLDEIKLSRLINLVQQTESRVVISSHWRLVQPLHSRLKAVLRYSGIEVIGSTPMLPPSMPRRPMEVFEWLHSYNTQAGALGRPHVSQFVVVDDRNLLNEEGGEQLKGNFVRTDPRIGLTELNVQAMLAVLTATSTAAIPGLPADPAELRTDSIKLGEFGEVRFNMDTGHAPLAGSDSLRLRLFSCNMAFKDAWSGAPTTCGDGTGRRPSPWIVAVPPSQTRSRSGSKKPEEDESVKLSTAEICGRLGGVTLDGTVLGKGGFGIVYRGTWEGHLAAESDGPRMDGNKTAVAVKRAPAGDEIRREAKLMGSLDHPHILKLLTSFDSAEDDSKHDSKHDAQAAEGTAAMATSSKWSSASGSSGPMSRASSESGSVGGELYLVLELCEGPDLQTILDARGALEEVECRRLIAQLTSALCYLRTRSIIHRDVKPANVMLLNTLPDVRTSLLLDVHLKLLDFGFAKALSGLEASRHGGGSRLQAAREASRHGGNNFSRHGGSLHGGSRHGGGGMSSHARNFFSAALFREPGQPGLPSPTTSPVAAEPSSPVTSSSVVFELRPASDGASQDTHLDETTPPPKLRRPPSQEASGSPTPEGLTPERGRRPSFVEDATTAKVEPDKSVHGVSPKGTRAYAFHTVANPGQFMGQMSKRSVGGPGPGPDGRLPMTRDEAHQLDAYPLGRMLRYMLTGVPPDKSIMDAQSDADSAACIGCLLSPIRGRQARRRIVDPIKLSKEARQAMLDFSATTEKFTVFDAIEHPWLKAEEDIVPGLSGSFSKG